MRLRFVRSSSAASGAPSLCLRPLAGVAVHSTPLTTTGRLGFALESAAARVCREAGGRVTLNVRVSDLDLPPRGAQDQRRLEVVADGLPLFHGAQLAIDTTMVSAVRGDAGPLSGWMVQLWCTRGAGKHVPRALGSGRARLVVLACEVGGRWSVESVSFLSQLAKAKVRHEPPAIRAPVTPGCADGAPFLPATRPGPSPRPCWSCVVGLAPTVPHPRALRWLRMTGFPVGRPGTLEC